MDLKLSGRTAVITGGSMGIGKVIGEGFVAEGVNVVLIARTQETLDQAAEEVRKFGDAEVMAIAADLTDSESVNAAIEQAAKKFGDIHILVNNAGHRMRRFDRQILWDDEDWTGDVDIKTIGMLRIIRATLPHFPKDGTGRIINVSGVAATMVFGSAMTHGINNAAMTHATRYLARDLAEEDINVNVVLPGLVATEWRHGWAENMAKQQGISKEEFVSNYANALGMLSGTWGQPEEVADLVVFLASDRAKSINGESILIDSGMNINPRV